ncbi:MAG: cytochrome C oxidase subunit IV family protein [Gemmatimonadetes bacterium]|nr:cytochrome C oxidase subunit IV family protein [Gemmatimonadota bacterium]
MEKLEKAHRNYFLVWGILFVLTLAELGVAFISLPKKYIIVMLLFLAVWKALLVALYYMHLRFEPRRMWILAASPIPLIIILLIAVLAEGF